MALQLAAAQRHADGAAVGAVFEVIPGENLPDQGVPLRGLGVPARLDGGFAGDGVQQVIPQAVRRTGDLQALG